MTSCETLEPVDPYADVSTFQRAESPMHRPRLCSCGNYSWHLVGGHCLACRCTVAGLPGAPAARQLEPTR